ncbi:hypothetical protein DUNSADRAFT_4826 [Dunaliella salina]|uniref:Encoded protein n=1 Tax=Dunaliella salina TaxID=3046 RepID=A0ABQ7GR77_DUNSA|nr:hypothetical protein DUNSADRAFT_4826 [Dunaliella salina]|eukprot:KAF5837103.1 hypothetical protein DUNSADRAFT_4826 [Dunaliella salina]
MRAICRVASSFHLARNIATISQVTSGTTQGCRESLRSAVYNGRSRHWPQVRPCELPKIPLKQGLLSPL